MTAAVAFAACTRCGTPLEHGDLRCAVCALVRPPDPTHAAPDGVRAKIVRCTECAAAVAFDPEVRAPRCAFCGAITRIEEPADPPEQAEGIVPFGVPRDAAAGALRAWLGNRGWLRPADLATTAAVESLHPLHWAAWVVDARALVSWAADSDAGSGRSAWAPHSGQTSMDFDSICVSASRGLTPGEVAALVPSYDLSTAVAMPPDGRSPEGPGLHGVVESFDVQRSAARRTVLTAIESTAAHRLTRGVIPGSKFRKVGVGVMLQGLRTRRVALPAWVLAYRYRGKPYRAVIHGQDAHVVVGKAPYSTWKILLVAGVIAAVIALIIAIVAGGGS